MQTITEEKTFNLVLKKKWFDMITSGEKLEEYRDISRLYVKRLCENFQAEYPYDMEMVLSHISGSSVLSDLSFDYKKYDVVRFRNGYASDAPEITLRFMGIEVRAGNENWGAEKDVKYFVIKLGEILSSKLLSKLPSPPTPKQP